jgi:hypothetical protein
MDKINTLVRDVQAGAILKTRSEVKGLNLPLVVEDIIDTVLIISGPYMERAKQSVENLGYKPVIVSSFYYPDKFVPNISLEDYYSESFSCVEMPKGFVENSWPYQVKLFGQHLSYSDVCRIFNHMTAWDYSIRTNKPVIILEHDSILHDRHDLMHPRFNSINMLSDIFYHQHNDNWVCAAGVHAYAIDCRVAKRLFNKIMSEGMINPLELMFRVDEFNVSISKKATKFKEIHEFGVSVY